jgi:hypothetical protein
MRRSSRFSTQTATRLAWMLLRLGRSLQAKKLNLEDAVDVINRDGHVFILVTTRAKLVVAELATSTNGDKPAAEANEVVVDNITIVVEDEDTTELV